MPKYPDLNKERKDKQKTKIQGLTQAIISANKIEEKRPHLLEMIQELKGAGESLFLETANELLSAGKTKEIVELVYGLDLEDSLKLKLVDNLTQRNYLIQAEEICDNMKDLHIKHTAYYVVGIKANNSGFDPNLALRCLKAAKSTNDQIGNEIDKNLELMIEQTKARISFEKILDNSLQSSQPPSKSPTTGTDHNPIVYGMFNRSIFPINDLFKIMELSLKAQQNTIKTLKGLGDDNQGLTPVLPIENHKS